MIDRLTIVGVGLLGGSVARAARVRGLAREIVGVGRDAARLEPALRDGALDRATTDLAAGVRGADFVLLATPVLAIERLLGAVWPLVEAAAVVTDVGSTKGTIVAAAERLRARRTVRFVGSHPMAGSERSGYAAGRADLFEGATVVVTPANDTDPAAVKAVSGLWEAVGARVRLLDPSRHDRVVAAISHLPHLAAWALVDAAERVEPAAFEFAARGFRDTTRIAASDPDVWREIFVANRPALRTSLGAFRASLDRLERLVDGADGGDDLRDALSALGARRRALG